MAFPVKIRVWTSIATLVALMPVGLHAQEANNSQKEFEVASVRPTGGPWNLFAQAIDVSPTRLTMKGVNLRFAIVWAYEVQASQVRGELPREAYDIVANAPDGTPIEHMRYMLRTLLRDRFGLRLHEEEKETGVRLLVVAKDGPGPGLKALESDQVKGEPRNASMNGGGGVRFHKFSMADFADALTSVYAQRGIDEYILDDTGLAGIWDITQTFQASARREDEEMDFLVLLKRQLGLELKNARRPMKFLVVDHSEPPSAN